MATETVESLCNHARDAIAERQWDRARQLYMQALAIRADSPDVHHGLATVCFQLRDLHSAAHHFKEVTRLDPLRAGAYINLGAIYNLLEQFDDAIPVLRRGIQLDSHRAEGYYNLGLVYRRKGQNDMAIQAYREAIRVNPRMYDAHYNLGNILLEKLQYAQAINHYKQALDYRPNWEKALDSLEQAQAALAEKEQQQTTSRDPGAKAAPGKPAASAAPAAPAIDPDRLIDPAIHSQLMTVLHNATIESETHGYKFLQILETEVDPALKELSSFLFFPTDSTAHDLDECVQKVETALQNLRSIDKNLQATMEKVRTTGDQLVRLS